MRFFARIKVGSAVDVIWRKHHRRSGTIEGVEFRLSESEFVSGEIEPVHMEALASNISIEIAAMTNPSAAVLETLVEVMKDPETSPEIQLKAAEVILDKAYPPEPKDPEPRRGRR